MTDRIWLTWERQRRNRTLSEALGAELYELSYKLPRVRRWFKATTATLRILTHNRPSLIFAQNPSLVLSLLTVWYGRLANRITIIDAHNAGVFPFSERSRWYQRLLRPLMQHLASHVIRLADITIVSNPALEAHVNRIGGQGFVLPDPLPNFSVSSGREDNADNQVVLFICTWAHDEPYMEVIKAAAKIDPRIRIYITGNSKGRESGFTQPLPANVILTGFVPEEEFVQLLHDADVVMDLTTLDDCLVCGAYEAVAVGRPMVLSDTKALRTYFHKGAVYADGNADAIARAVEQAVADRFLLARKVAELRRELGEDWELRRKALEALLSELVAQPAVTDTSEP